MELTTYRNLAIAGILLIGIGYGTGRYLQPARVEIKKEVEIKEVEVTKKNVVTHEHIVKDKDGNETIDRTTEDKSTEARNTESKTKESTVITNKKPDWRVNALAALSPDHDFANPAYGLQIERRILGPISVGAFGLTNKTVGLSVGIEF